MGWDLGALSLARPATPVVTRVSTFCGCLDWIDGQGRA
jgi:hypothetical protein